MKLLLLAAATTGVDLGADDWVLRQVVDETSLSLDYQTMPEPQGRTWGYPHTVRSTGISPRLYYGHQGNGPDVDMTFRAAIEYGGVVHPVTFDGNPSATIGFGETILSDPVSGLRLVKGHTVTVRTFTPQGPTVVSHTGANLYSLGDQTDAGAGPLDTHVGGGGIPTALAVLALTDPAEVSVALAGDSIAEQGRRPEFIYGPGTAGWFAGALDAADLPGICFGIPVTRMSSARDGRYGTNGIQSCSHVLSQFSVNDLHGGTGDTTDLKIAGLAFWRYCQDRGAQVWQTTATPIVETTDGCATLANQTITTGTGNGRTAWNTWLLDGAPIDSDDTPAEVGADGVLRAGDTEHPLTGVVDVGGHVQDPTETNKWRTDLPGGALSYDGVHLSDAGNSAFSTPVTAWTQAIAT